MKRDPVFETFLERQLRLGLQLAGESDLLDLLPVPESPPSQYLAHFNCRGLVWRGNEAVEAESFLVGIHFPRTYLQFPSPGIVTWLEPGEIWHPNILGPAGHICLGNLAPGTPLDSILEQCFRIITYQKLTMREDDALNHDACVWARRNQHRFPIDPRPLRRQTRAIRAEVLG